MDQSDFSASAQAEIDAAHLASVSPRRAPAGLAMHTGGAPSARPPPREADEAAEMRFAILSAEFPPGGIDPSAFEPWPPPGDEQASLYLQFALGRSARRLAGEDENACVGCDPMDVVQAMQAGHTSEPTLQVCKMLILLGRMADSCSAADRAATAPTGAWARLMALADDQAAGVLVDVLDARRGPQRAPLVLVRYMLMTSEDVRAQQRVAAAIRLVPQLRTCGAEQRFSRKAVLLLHSLLERSRAKLPPAYLAAAETDRLSTLSPGWRLSALQPVSLVPGAAAAAMRSKCAYCGKPRAAQECSACRACVSCNAACQRAHWPAHKGACSAARAVNVPSVVLRLDIARALKDEHAAYAAAHGGLPHHEHIVVELQLSGAIPGSKHILKAQTPMVDWKVPLTPPPDFDGAIMLYNRRRDLTAFAVARNCGVGAASADAAASGYAVLWRYIATKGIVGRMAGSQKVYVRAVVSDDGRELRLLLPETALPAEPW